ncbi:MAG TPA: dihydrolipoyllysine-residue acetyltransferase [Porticoccaceae bacterium]|nr:dihydrolipoyllysine-residue acetyltransferase [Porticoccaceae bacterium]HIK81097.1 dihydrolipoyllysine-residue acetyltransferase [Porticoccaceae bacterium]
MKIDFILPDIGEGIIECEVIEWKVKEGDLIEEDQVVADVSTDKAIVEIPSMHSGRVTKLYYDAGDIAKVHSPLYAIEIDDAQTSESTNVETKPDLKLELVKQQPVAKHLVDNTKVLTTPAVRKLARQNDLDLSKIEGSGKQGRVLKEDVLRYLDKPLVPIVPTLITVGQDRREPIVGVRKIMARHMSDSVSSIPHFTFVDEIDVTELIKLRASLKARYGNDDLKITLMPLLMKALSLSLLAFPIINSRVDSDFSELTYLANHNIGMAVDGKTGLLVPNVKDVQQRSIVEIAQEIGRLTGAARSGIISPADLKGGTLTMSNIGAIGGISAAPIINKPEVAIVALGKIQGLPRFDGNGQLVERQIMTVSWSGDHRVIDGATIARFNNHWKAYLETPDTMMANMI